jgi:hypothetical protein
LSQGTMQLVSKPPEYATTTFIILLSRIEEIYGAIYLDLHVRA